MEAGQASRATAAAIGVVTSLGLAADEAITLHDSNKLTLRLLPCDVVARVAPGRPAAAQFEVDIAQRLTAARCPVAALEPRADPVVYERDGFVMTLWTHYEDTGAIEPIAYAEALQRLHVGMATVTMPTPHFLDRVREARDIVSDHERSPALEEEDRAFLGQALDALQQAVMGRGVDQLLHGEPHPGNVLGTRDGPIFIDLETCCVGPVEFDVAHAPEQVADHYPGLDRDLLRDCRSLVLAMIIAWRFEPDDQLPNGRALAAEWLAELRAH